MTTTKTQTSCNPKPADRVIIAGLAVDNLSEDQTLVSARRLIAQGGSHYMVVVNAAKVVAVSRDPELRQVVSGADLVTADGMSLVLASRLLRRPLKGRVTGIDLFERLVAAAAEDKLAVYFLGGRDESVGGVVERFKTRFPDLRIAGFRNGYFLPADSERIAASIEESGADLLFVAMGSPAQEFWIAKHLEKTGVRFALGVGGSFDHFSGLARRAPRWMQRAGLEWFYRLVREPRRLWRRYLIGNTLFIWLVVKQLLKMKY